LIGRWQEFQLYGEFHYVSTLQVERLCKRPLKRAKARCFLPGLKLLGLHT
jgi:hypothetical protein